MKPDPAAWFEKAEHDLLAIKNNLAATSVPWDVVVFHTQQATEKYLKGFLVQHQILPPKIHDLSRLLALCLIHDRTLESLRDDCVRILEASGRSRYPGDPDPTEAEADVAIEGARRVRDAIRQRVPVQ